MFHRGSVGALRFNSAPALAGVQAIGPVRPMIVTDPASGSTAAKSAFPFERPNWGPEAVFKAAPGSVLRAPAFSRVLPWGKPLYFEPGSSTLKEVSLRTNPHLTNLIYLYDTSALIPKYRDGAEYYNAVEYIFPEGGVWVYTQWAELPPAIVPYWVTGTPRRIA